MSIEKNIKTILTVVLLIGLLFYHFQGLDYEPYYKNDKDSHKNTQGYSSFNQPINFIENYCYEKNINHIKKPDLDE